MTGLRVRSNSIFDRAARQYRNWLPDVTFGALPTDPQMF
jgi:hypothetical protein